MNAITMIAVGDLKVADDNVRFAVGDIADLAATLTEHGVIAPLLVREDDLLVVAGARRLAAAKKAGLKEVPVIKRKFTEQERVEVMLVENLQREDLQPLEEASGLKRLSEMGHTQREIAKRVGRSQAHVAKRLSLLELPETVQKAVDSGGIKLEAAQQLAKLKDNPKAVERIVKAAIEDQSSKSEVRQAYATEEVSRKVSSEIAKAERLKKLEAAEKQLAKKEKNVVRLTGDAHSPNAPKGMAIVMVSSWKASDIVMKPSEHKKLACHAVGLNHATLEEVEVCTDPKKHKTVKQAQESEEQKRRKAREKAEAAQAAMEEGRHSFAAQFVQGKVSENDLLELLAIRLGQSAHRTLEFACELLGVTQEEVDAIADGFPEDFEVVPEDVLEPRMEKSKVENVRTLTAILLAQEEASSYGTPRAAYLGFLKSKGFKLSKLEQRILDEYEKERKHVAEQIAAAKKKPAEKKSPEKQAPPKVSPDVETPEVVDLMESLKNAVGKEAVA